MSARDLPPELLAQVWANLPQAQRESIRTSAKKGLDALKTPEPITLYQWAERNFELSAESSQNALKWHAYPFQRGMLCMLGDQFIEEVDVLKSARVGYTKMALAFMAMQAEHRRRSGCVWQPTDKDSDEFCKAEVEPMLRDVRVMRKVFPQHMSKSKANTLNMKKFLGSLQYFKGGTSAGNFRRMTLQWFIGDEFSAFDDKIEGSADPWTLMWKRLEGATRKKGIVGSTPRVAGRDHTERRYLAALARMRFHISCPHCDADHPLMPGNLEVQAKGKAKHGFVWDMADPEGTVRHVCPHCLESITQADYLRLWESGVWVSDCGNYRCYALANGEYYWTDGVGCRLAVPPRHVGIHVWTAYSKTVGWDELVRDFLLALGYWNAGDRGPMEGFVNETLGKTTKDHVEEADGHAIRKRAEPYPLRRVPVGGLEVVAGVDTQDSWWAVTLLAVGRDDEAWVVDYAELNGDPGNKKDWETILLPYLDSLVYHWKGAPMRVQRAGIDHGGSHSAQVGWFCRKYEARKFHAIKGESQAGKPIRSRMVHLTINQQGKKVRTGEKLWFIGTDTAKDLIYSRLQLAEHGPGYLHFSKGLEARYFDGLTSEVRRRVRTVKGMETRWETKTANARNEPLDTLVYALWASDMQDHHKFTEVMWRMRESALEPDLFMATEEPVPEHVGPASERPPIDVETILVPEVSEGDDDDADEEEASAVPAASLPAAPLGERRISETQRVDLFEIAYGNH